jgi:hypothetical protein
VTRAGEDDQPGVRDKSGGAAAGQLKRVVLVCVALDDEGGDVDTGQVGAQVGRGIGVEGRQQDLERQVHHLAPGSAVKQRGNGVARTEEIFGGAGRYRRAGIVAHRLPRPAKYLGGDPAGVGWPLAEGRGAGSAQHQSREPAVGVRREVADGLRGAQGVAGQDRVAQVQMTGDGGNVTSEGVQVVATARHVRPAMAAAVEGDAAQPGLHQTRDLVIPHVLAGPESVH